MFEYKNGDININKNIKHFFIIENKTSKDGNEFNQI